MILFIFILNVKSFVINTTQAFTKIIKKDVMNISGIHTETKLEVLVDYFLIIVEKVKKCQLTDGFYLLRTWDNVF